VVRNDGRYEIPVSEWGVHGAAPDHADLSAMNATTEEKTAGMTTSCTWSNHSILHVQNCQRRIKACAGQAGCCAKNAGHLRNDLQRANWLTLGLTAFWSCFGFTQGLIIAYNILRNFTIISVVMRFYCCSAAAKGPDFTSFSCIQHIKFFSPLPILCVAGPQKLQVRALQHLYSIPINDTLRTVLRRRKNMCCLLYSVW